MSLDVTPSPRGRLVVELVALGSLTLAAYAALWFTQNALWTNGLSSPQLSPELPRPGADVDAGFNASVRVMLLGAAVTFLAAWLIARARRFHEARLTWVALAIPLVVAIGFFVLPPTLSIDAYSYLSHGFLAAAPGANPYVDTSASVMATSFGGELLRNGWQPVHGLSPYGPLWTAFERAAYVLSRGSVPAGIVLIKIPTFAAVLGTGALIWHLLGRLAPERRLTGTLLFFANPLVLIELVGDGHNDAVVGFFVVVAVAATVRRRAFVAVLAITAAVLVKSDALPLGLLVVVALVLWRRSRGRVLLELLAGLVVAAAGAAALFAPYWVGFATFDGLFAQGAAVPGWSVSGILAALLRPATAQLVLSSLLVLATVAACFLVRTVTGFIRACGIVSLVILVLLPADWPWYAALPSTLLALEATELDVVMVLLLALGSRLVAPIGDASAIGAMTYQLFTTTQAFLGQTVPGIVALYATVSRAARTARAARGSRQVRRMDSGAPSGSPHRAPQSVRRT